MHVHLEACARPPLARRMAARYGESIEDVIAPDGESYRHTDFTSFLDAYSRVANLFRTAEDYAELTETYLDELAAARTIYAEIILWPDHPERLGLPADDYLAGVREGIARHAASQGDAAVTTRLLVTGVRHEGVEAVERAGRTAVRWHDEGPRAVDADAPLVTGFGLAGDERVGHPRDFERAFSMAREAGMGLACHAGELCGPESVRAALDHLDPDRIDHGVRAIEDLELVRRLADMAMPLTVCIGSNLALGVFPSLDAHPARALNEAGCHLMLGSDDPPHFGTSLAGEYGLAARKGLDVEMLTRSVFELNFCDDGTRERITARHGIELSPHQAGTRKALDRPARSA